jgi:DNA-binding XRE family transcriptional regulator
VNAIKAERMNRGESLTAAAAAMGIHIATLVRIEREGRLPTAPVAKAIADHYGLRVTDLWPTKEAA